MKSQRDAINELLAFYKREYPDLHQLLQDYATSSKRPKNATDSPSDAIGLMEWTLKFLQAYDSVGLWMPEFRDGFNYEKYCVSANDFFILYKYWSQYGSDNAKLNVSLNDLSVMPSLQASPIFSEELRI